MARKYIENPILTRHIGPSVRLSNAVIVPKRLYSVFKKTVPFLLLQ